MSCAADVSYKYAANRLKHELSMFEANDRVETMEPCYSANRYERKKDMRWCLASFLPRFDLLSVLLSMPTFVFDTGLGGVRWWAACLECGC